MATNTIDNVLHFVASNFDTLERQKLDTLLVENYKLEELTAAKLLLISECEKINITEDITEFVKRRLLTKSEIALKQKIAKDILDIWTVADLKKGGHLQTDFVAADCTAATTNTTAEITGTQKTTSTAPAAQS